MAVASIQPVQSLAITRFEGEGEGDAAGEQGFDSILTRASSAAAETGQDKDQQLRHASEELVSNALIQPLLKQMRDSPFKVKMFHGGDAEQAFGQKLDTVLSDRIVHSANFPIVNAVYQSLNKHSAVNSASMLGGRLKTHG